MTARAVIRESELRRWARISREQGVAIRGRIEGNSVTITIDPAGYARDRDDDACRFEEQMQRFLRK
jgi:hypothetical protein